MKWIDVKISTPKNDRKVLVKNGDNFGIGFHIDDHFENGKTGKAWFVQGTDFFEPTHWKEIES